MQRENEQPPWFPVAFYSKGLNSAQKKYSTYDHKLLATFLECKKFQHFLEGRKFQLKDDHQFLVPSLLREKTSDSVQQQQQLSYLTEMTSDFEYIAGPLNAAAEALSRLPAGEEADKVCTILPADSPQHWDEKNLLAAQKEVVSLTSRFLLAGAGEKGPLRLLRKAKPPEVPARSILLLPPTYRQAAIKALHEDTHAGQQQNIKMASDRYILPGLGRDIKKFVKSCPVCQQVKINKQKKKNQRACQTRKFPNREDSFQDSPRRLGRTVA